MIHKTTLLLLFTFVVSGSGYGQLKKGQINQNLVPAPQWHYQSEYTFDSTTDPAAWARQERGLHVAFGSTDRLYMRSEVPELSQPVQVWSETGWKGERQNAQVLVWLPDALSQVRIHVTDLVNSAGELISRDHIRVNLVRYVLSNFSYAAREFSCDSSNDSVYLMPDRLESFDRFDIPGRRVRPVWIAVVIDASVEPGDYTGAVEVVSSNYKAFQKVHQTYTRTNLWLQICKSSGEDCFVCI